MNWLWRIARLTACSAALLLTGSVAMPVPLPALEQEKEAPNQKPTESFGAIRRYAEQGDALAQDHLGHMYASGQGVPRNYTEAIRWYRKAAEQGDADAQYNLGFLYDAGHGRSQDAFVAVDNGKVVEQTDAGSSRGQPVPQDDAEAVRWYRMAAQQGHVYAQSNLGIMYAEGHGVLQDDAEAVHWYRKAAEQGDADAQGNLGLMYDLGRGVQDSAEAVRWYRKAAEQGEPAAQENLGRMYERGRGVPRDYVQGYLWMDLGVSRSSGDAQREFAAKRDSLGEKMTAQQIAEARRLAREWKPKPMGIPARDQ